jgi:hypothetical protein
MKVLHYFGALGLLNRYSNRLLVGADFSPLHSVETGPGAHPVFYQMGARHAFPRVKSQGMKPTTQLHLLQSQE